MKHVLTFSIAALLIVGLTMPLVMAKPGDEEREHRGRSEEMREKGQELREKARQMAEERKANHSKRPAPQAFSINITASGKDQDNVSYSIDATGLGLVKIREHNGTVTGVKGAAKLNVTLKDENGTVVKQGEIRVHIVGHLNETSGEWRWHLVSHHKTPKGLPKLFLMGDNGTVDNGTATLKGDGFALVKVEPEKQRRMIRLDAEVELAKI